VLYPAAEPWRGRDPRAGLSVELAEPPVAIWERPVAHLGEQFCRRAPAVLDAGYLAGVVTDPLPELGKRPPGRAPRPAHLPSEVPGWIARAIAHRLTPWPGALKRDGEGLEVDAEGIAAPAVALRAY